MYIAKDTDLHHVFLGKEIGQCLQDVPQRNLCCPICNKQVTYNGASEHPFEYFHHDDGSPDCTESEATSEGHRLPVEVAVKVIHNRIREVSGEPVDINVEKWIGSANDYNIADIRVSSPIRIAAEIFYRASYLELSRRLSTMFRNGYSVYLIFNTAGRHDTEKVERDIQRIAPLQIGRFNPGNMEISLGDLFNSEQIQFDQSARKVSPSYLI
jgi:hypothetical protein